MVTGQALHSFLIANPAKTPAGGHPGDEARAAKFAHAVFHIPSLRNLGDEWPFEDTITIQVEDDGWHCLFEPLPGSGCDIDDASPNRRSGIASLKTRAEKRREEKRREEKRREEKRREEKRREEKRRVTNLVQWLWCCFFIYF